LLYTENAVNETVSQLRKTTKASKQNKPVTYVNSTYCNCSVLQDPEITLSSLK